MDSRADYWYANTPFSNYTSLHIWVYEEQCREIGICPYLCGGNTTKITTKMSKYSESKDPYSLSSPLHRSPNPTTAFLPIATVPASPNSAQCTQPAVPCNHPQCWGRPSMDGSGEPGSWWPRDVESTAEGEGKAVSWFGAHCIRGDFSFLKQLIMLFFFLLVTIYFDNLL